VKQILCPQCGVTNNDPEGLRSSNSFCVACDYPLFFTATTVQRPNLETEMARNRLPGVAGKIRRVSQSCPDCSELNPPENTNCLRCNAPLIPIIEEEPVVVPEPVVVIKEVFIEAEPLNRWPLISIGAACGIVGTVYIYLLAIWIW
jgi:hypothetical protein